MENRRNIMLTMPTKESTSTIIERIKKRISITRGDIESLKMQRDYNVRIILFACAIFATTVVFLIIFLLFERGYETFLEYDPLAFFLGTDWRPKRPYDLPPVLGALPLILGTVYTTGLAMLIAIPLALGMAIFIAAVVPKKLRDVFKVAIELLAGIPSVIYGLFGAQVISRWMRVINPESTGHSMISAAIILAVISLPTMVTVIEDAITAVPRSLWEGSFAIGATRWQTLNKVVLPSSVSGITVGIILGMGRAIGETMAVIMVAGNSPVIPTAFSDIFKGIRTITASIGLEMGDAVLNSLHQNALFALGIVLFVIVLVVNAGSTQIISRMKERLSGKGKIDPSTRVQAKAGTWKARIRDAWVSLNAKVDEKTRNAIRVILIVIISLVLLCWMVGTFLGFVFFSIIFIGYVILKFLPPRAMQAIAFGLITIGALIVLGILGLILFNIFENGGRFLTWEFVSQPPRFTEGEGFGETFISGGVQPAIIGTIQLVAGAILFSVPIGIGAAVYLNEYTKENRLKKFIRSGIENLNGTPSIVFGLFGLSFFCYGLGLGKSMLAGQLTLGLMILPTIIRTTEEALKSVPASLREASLAIGATKWETTTKVVLPAAIPGTLTGVILGIGRAAGETAPIMFTAAVFFQPIMPISVLQPIMALPYYIYRNAEGIPGGVPIAYGTAALLLIIVLALYSVSIIIRYYYRSRLKW